MTSEFVTLKNGLTLPVAAIDLALDLEAKGFRLEAQAGALRVSRTDAQPPGDLLSTEDREAIKRWKLHLLAIVAYPDKRTAVLSD